MYISQCMIQTAFLLINKGLTKDEMYSIYPAFDIFLLFLLSKQARNVGDKSTAGGFTSGCSLYVLKGEVISTSLEFLDYSLLKP